MDDGLLWNAFTRPYELKRLDRPYSRARTVPNDYHEIGDEDGANSHCRRS
jgi:hypothetical protein